MSDYLLPDLPGLKPDRSRQPAFATKVQRSVSGSEVRAAFQAYPLWTFTLAYEVLGHGAETDLRALLGFFLARRGAFDSFLYRDPDDNAVTDQVIGVGDGARTQYQLLRSFGYGVGATFDEPVHNVAAIGAVKVNGAATGAYTVNGAGLITLAAPPPGGQVVSWSGGYYFRCRFLQDEAEFNRFLQDLWELKRLQFVGSPLNKV